MKITHCLMKKSFFVAEKSTEKNAIMSKPVQNAHEFWITVHQLRGLNYVS